MDERDYEAMNKELNQPGDGKDSFRCNAIEFAKWLQHLDNGTTHYNPFTKEETHSIGFSPYECLIDEIYTIEELYDKWESLNNDI